MHRARTGNGEETKNVNPGHVRVLHFPGYWARLPKPLLLFPLLLLLLCITRPGFPRKRFGRTRRVKTTAVVKEGGKETDTPETLGLICNVAIVQHKGKLHTR